MTAVVREESVSSLAVWTRTVDDAGDCFAQAAADLAETNNIMCLWRKTTERRRFIAMCWSVGLAELGS
jgi:hypothetical protein